MMIPKKNPIPTLLEFIKQWVPQLSPEHGIAKSLIPDFIPFPLQSIYQIAGNWPVPNHEQWRSPQWIPGLFGPQDQLLPVDQLKVNANRFKFIHENQGVWSCETLINEDDPPVFSDSLAYEYGDQEMRLVCVSLSHFLTTFCLQELVFGANNLYCVDSEVKNLQCLVAVEPKDVWIDGVYVYGEPTHSFYLCKGDLIIMKTEDSYWIASNNDDSLNIIDQKANEIRRIH